MQKNNQLSALLDKLIKDGEILLNSCHGDRELISDRDGVRAWSNELILFVSLAGELVAPWKNRLHHDGMALVQSALYLPHSALKTIRYAMDEGLLVRYEDLVVAETFADLSQQASYLLSQGYFLAAGVIFRSILEERLRKMCARHGCTSNRASPTINDYNTALYTAQPPVYDKGMMQHITALASVGNDAAHNNPALKKEDVERLQRGLTDFLARFSA
jgi:hypothetical protein